MRRISKVRLFQDRESLEDTSQDIRLYPLPSNPNSSNPVVRKERRPRFLLPSSRWKTVSTRRWLSFRKITKLTRSSKPIKINRSRLTPCNNSRRRNRTTSRTCFRGATSRLGSVRLAYPPPLIKIRVEIIGMGGRVISKSWRQTRQQQIWVTSGAVETEHKHNTCTMLTITITITWIILVLVVERISRRTIWIQSSKRITIRFRRGSYRLLDSCRESTGKMKWGRLGAKWTNQRFRSSYLWPLQDPKRQIKGVKGTWVLQREFF